jgi:hypothetical protein
MAVAERMRSEGLIVAAVLCLDDQVATVGLPSGGDAAAAVTPVLASAADRRFESAHLRRE